MNTRNLKMFFRILFQGVRNQKNRMTVGIFCVLIGAMVISSLINLYCDISNKMNEEFKSYGANFFVGGDSLDESILGSIVTKISRENVVALSPFLYGMARLDLGEAILVGVDFPGFKKLNTHWPIQGQWVTMAFDDRHCVIGQTLAKKMHLNVGDALTIYSDDLATHKSITVKGIIHTGEDADDQIFVNLSLAQKILGLTGKIHHVLLRVDTTPAEAEVLARDLSHSSLKAYVLKNVSYSEGKILNNLESLMTLMVFTITLLMALVLMTTLTAMMMERRKEIALMKALGAKNRVILSHFMAEIVLIVLAGMILGIPSGYALAQIFGKTIFGSWVAFRSIVIPITLTIIMGISLMAAMIPIKRAYRLKAATLLKEE